MRRAYFDARFLTMLAVLVVVSTVLGSLGRGREYGRLAYHSQNAYGLLSVIQCGGIFCNSLVGNIMPSLASPILSPKYGKELPA